MSASWAPRSPARWRLWCGASSISVPTPSCCARSAVRRSRCAPPAASPSPPARPCLSRGRETRPTCSTPRPAAVATTSPPTHPSLDDEETFMIRTLLVGLLPVALTGGASPVTAQAPVELSFYYPVAVGGPVTKIIDGLAADFQKENPGIHVKPIYAGTYQETIVKVLTALKSGEPPQMSVLLSTDMFTLIDDDAIVPFDDLATGAEDRSWLKSFFPAFMLNSQTGGKTWGVPFQRSTIVLYWNKEAFKEAGLDPNRPPATWAEQVEYARKLTKRDGGGNFHVFKKSTPAQQAASLKFIKWITSPQRAAQWGIDTGYVAVRPDAWETPAMKQYVAGFPAAAVARDQLQYAVAELSTHDNQRVTKALNDGLQAALTGAKPADQAMKDAQREAERILRPYRR